MTEWRPISEAPKDGTQILASNGIHVWLVSWDEHKHLESRSGWKFESGQFPNGEWFYHGINSDGVLTKWQPCPQPPKENE